MYQRILLASDGAMESLVALREGALIARGFGAKAHLLIIERDDRGRRMANGIYALSCGQEDDRALLELGLSRLAKLGVPSSGEVVRGDPALVIAECAHRFGADLIVVGHRRRTFMERWWLGPSGAYVIDGVACSVLVARDVVTDEAFEAQLERSLADA